MKVVEGWADPYLNPYRVEKLRSSTMVMLYQFKRCAGKDSPANHSLRFSEAKWADNSSDDDLAGTA